MKKWWLYWFAQVLTSLLFKTFATVSRVTGGLLFFRLTVVGLENLPKNKVPAIITPTHHSYLDHFFILGVLPFNSKLLPARAIAADWLFHIPNHKFGFIIRWGLMLFGCYPTKRGTGLQVSLRDQLRVLKNGGTAVIYPQGGIRSREGVESVKVGAAFLGQKSGAVFIPIAFRGLARLTLKNFLFGRRHVIVIIGKPFHVERAENFEDLSQDARKALLEKNSHLIKDKINELYKQKAA